MGTKRLKNIWEAKQLGFSGRSPHTDCDEDCLHYRYGVDLPEGALEPAKPLPLIYARGLEESGFDFGLEYLRGYADSLGLWWNLYEAIDLARRDAQRKAKLVKDVVKETRLPESMVEGMLFGDQEVPDSKQVFKGMSGEFEPWEKLLPRKWWTKVRKRTTVKGRARRFYAIPEDSDEFIRRSWGKW